MRREDNLTPCPWCGETVKRRDIISDVDERYHIACYEAKKQQEKEEEENE